ncbi:hypothetical protein RclHR1_00120003 [Rhizophagus clarus]|uniref:BTB domain-containing protein n=1 Tax=Rhizophagus clarus TaxID=94130 RepID=A0A2Z6QI37_9GLOM|nr:hypothetical protein RclHR1_00120003 [Rhizophagus clarus]GES93535.1 hypothetical protein GLOIN_2v1782772 [Rhizophagus clarus]
MTTQFLTKLVQNYIELLDDDEYYDVTIEVGEDPNVKFLHAHKSILCCRSPYLRRALEFNKTQNKDNVLTYSKLPNISPEIFQIILRYIYGGILSLNEQDTSEIFNLLLAVDEFHIQELIDYLQKYLIENKSEWIEQNFEFVHRKSFQSNSLLEIQQFCTDLMTISPEKVFESLDFTSLPEKSLVQLIKRDDLQMKEIEVWEHVLKWGRAQNKLDDKPDDWSDNDFENMRKTLQPCLPLIRFFSLSSKEFLQKVIPHQKLLDRKVYENLLISHLNPDSELTDENILLPRNIKIERFIDSKIIDLNIISIISRWVDKTVIITNSKFGHLRDLYLPYKFELLLRGSRDGFTPKKIHELCDGKSNTFTFIKIKEIDEIIGGYNPLAWKSSNTKGKTKDSFIFSFKNKNIKDAIFSNVKDIDLAVCNCRADGPFFGRDIIIKASNESTNYNTTYCKKYCYEKRIRDIEGNFQMEDFEVFQIIKK